MQIKTVPRDGWRSGSFADVGGVVFDGCDPHNFMELSVEH